MKEMQQLLRMKTDLRCLALTNRFISDHTLIVTPRRTATVLFSTALLSRFRGFVTINSVVLCCTVERSDKEP